MWLYNVLAIDNCPSSRHSDALENVRLRRYTVKVKVAETNRGAHEESFEGHR
jgi:hypothetical protein